MIKKDNLLKTFIKYVTLNVIGMIGTSCYILADTFFVANGLGSNGLAALNISISIFSIMNAIGLMIGIGGATRFAFLKAQKEDKKANMVYINSVGLGLIFAAIFLIAGIFFSRQLCSVLGASGEVLDLANDYLNTLLIFSPFFILNNIILAFVRNDGNPKLSMIAMLSGSFLNVILDYVFIFPLGMGMFGAAFATGLSPICGLVVLSLHFIKKKNTFTFRIARLKIKEFSRIISLGLSSFITEVSSAVILLISNLVIIGLMGNIGVAAYGIIANVALVLVAVFTGVAQGVQPIISNNYATKNQKAVTKVYTYAVILSFLIAVISYASIFLFSEQIVGLFNSENNPHLSQIAQNGLKLYFIGFIFAGINIVSSASFSSMQKIGKGFAISITRGFLAIIPLLLILPLALGINGVWLAFAFTEFIAFIILSFILIKNRGLR